jgi:hypothetical protein
MLEETASVRIELRDGRFDFQVDKLGFSQRFVLTLPDGELEVQGTRFITDVAGGRTRSLSVQEGRVALRIAGSEEVILVGGDVWPPASAVEQTGVKQEETEEEVAIPDLESFPSAPSEKPAHPEVTPTVKAPSGSGPETEPNSKPDAAGGPTPTGQSEFAIAMSAFSAGDFARAEALFLAFEQHHPYDRRVEDSTFLRAVARSRRGDATGARQLAREYLRRYPKGLRRLEAERLAGNR